MITALADFQLKLLNQRLNQAELCGTSAKKTYEASVELPEVTLQSSST